MNYLQSLSMGQAVLYVYPSNNAYLHKTLQFKYEVKHPGSRDVADQKSELMINLEIFGFFFFNSNEGLQYSGKFFFFTHIDKDCSLSMTSVYFSMEM